MQLVSVGSSRGESCGIKAGDDIENDLELASSQYQIYVDDLSTPGCSYTGPWENMGITYGWAYSEWEAYAINLYPLNPTYFENVQLLYFSGVAQASEDNVQAYVLDSSYTEQDFNGVGTLYGPDDLVSDCTHGGTHYDNAIPSSWFANSSFNEEYSTSYEYPDQC
jgi:hypothetical protein